MRLTLLLPLAALLPVFAGCQMFSEQPSNPNVGTSRLQGELVSSDGPLLFKPCTEARRFVVNDAADLGLSQDVKNLPERASGKVFADLRGTLGSTPTATGDGTFDVTRVYRLEAASGACDDPAFKRLTVHASGENPTWDLKASGKGMVLNRQGQPPLALPFVEEQIPGGSLNLSTEANHQQIQVWLAPQRCVDTGSGAIRHLHAELRIDGQTLQGCGYYGGARDN